VWYKLAAAQGYSSAQYRLGIMYGLGLDRSVAEAIHWLSVAAKAGDDGALYAQGHLNETADGIRNYQTAFEHYQSSARRGNKDAQLRLAQMFAQGLGVARNEGDAAKWQALAEQPRVTDSNTDTSFGIDDNWHGNPGWGGHR
jgi:TPR repeat protein